MDIVTYSLARAYADKLSSGEPAEMRRSGDWIEWRRVGGLEWHQLVPLVDIAGPQGLQGIQGEKGEKGDTGAGLSVLGSFDAPEDLPSSNNEVGDAYLIDQHLWVWDGDEWVDTGTIQGPKGETGKSAYQEAVDLGFQGDVSEWLASLKGEKGDGLEFQWDGTILKVRVEGDTTWDSVDLQGEQGPEASMPPRLAEQAIPANPDVTEESGWATEGTPVSSTFTRASQAWDGTGLVAPDTMRVFGRDTKSPVVLIEGQRTNLLDNSDHIITITETSTMLTTPAPDPNGGMTATKMEIIGGTTESRNRSAPIAPAGHSISEVTLTFWIKAGSVSSAGFGIYEGGWGADSNAEILAGPGEVVGTSTSGLRGVTGLSDEAWTKVRLTRHDLDGSSALGTYFYPGSSSGANQEIGDSVIIWGGQAEEAPFPSSYIPTDGAPATRAADNFSLNHATDSSGDWTVHLAVQFSEAGVRGAYRRFFNLGPVIGPWADDRFATGLGSTLPSGHLDGQPHVLTWCKHGDVGQLFDNGELLDTGPPLQFPSSGVITVGNRNGSGHIFALVGPGAAQLGIPFIDNRAWSEAEIKAAHARWLPELEKIEVPV